MNACLCYAVGKVDSGLSALRHETSSQMTEFMCDCIQRVIKNSNLLVSFVCISIEQTDSGYRVMFRRWLSTFPNI